MGNATFLEADMSGSTQLAVLSIATVAIFLLIVSFLAFERYLRETSPGSAHFSTARASTNLRKKIEPVIGPGVEILMPAGAGHYALTLSRLQQQKWLALLKHWMDRGARTTIIITSPDLAAVTYWQPLVDALVPSLRVCLLDRNLATRDDAEDIRRLDTFHPVLIVRDTEPLGMWIESRHDPESNVAYNVEYIAKGDIVNDQRLRFDRFLSVLRKLTDTDRDPPHLKDLTPSGKAVSKQTAMRMAA